MNKGPAKAAKPVVTFQHLLNALSETKPSLSESERLRYTELYKEFKSEDTEAPPKERKLKSSLA